MKNLLALIMTITFAALVVVGCGDGKKKSGGAPAPTPQCQGVCPNPNPNVKNPSRLAYFWAGPLHIENALYFRFYIESVSGQPFCVDDALFGPECSDYVAHAQQAWIAGNTANDAMVFVGVDALSGQPNAEVGINLVKTLGYGGYYPLGPVDIYRGQLLLFNNSTAYVMNTVGYAYPPRNIMYFINSTDLNAANLQMQIFVDNQLAATVSLARGYDFYANSFYAR